MHHVLLYRKRQLWGMELDRGGRGQPPYKFVLLLFLTAEILQDLSEKGIVQSIRSEDPTSFVANTLGSCVYSHPYFINLSHLARVGVKMTIAMEDTKSYVHTSW